MRKLIYGLVAACLSATPAAAFDPPFVWVGQMVLLELDNCGGGGSDTVAIVYRPKLQAGEDSSTLSYLFGFASGTVRKRAPTLQINDPRRKRRGIQNSASCRSWCSCW